ncbi:MAG TPA: FAD-binding oxidoreductase [Streptosporangiaceae bacterium]|nr:FAD-binding oxidoreductase [Streptosporangiaceae bacterium]
MGTGTSGSAAETIPAALANACSDIAAASDSDAIGGRQARFVAAPASANEAAALLRAAADLGLTVVARGSGSRQHWGAAPASCDLIVDTRRLDRVVEHAAGDLVVTTQAGVRLDDLAAVLATAGQRLALDSSSAGQREPAGTVGGMIATGAAGPLRYRFGGPRDLLIGITVVRADGTIARSGGKVVKNVAGYDLGKLFAGSFGTLGLITEATFRLHPKPETSTWIAVIEDNPQSAAETARAMADAPLAPSAIELSWPSAADSIAVSVLLEGDRASVDGRAERMMSLLTRGTAGSVARGTAGSPSGHTKRPDGRSAHPTLAAEGRDQTAPVHHRGRTASAATTIRIAFWSGELATVLGIIRESGAQHGVDPAISGSAGAGVLEVSVDHEVDAEAVAGFINELRARLGAMAAGGVVPSVASAVVVQAPPEVRDSVEMWGPVPSLRLMRAVKDQFDPEHRLAPGRFAGGI